MQPEVIIHDIRRHGCDSVDLRSELVSGLLGTECEKHLPSLLLWDERGQALFEAIISSSDYYPYRAELDLLKQEKESIVAPVKSETVIIELGAG